jgi:hypothetical protein
MAGHVGVEEMRVRGWRMKEVGEGKRTDLFWTFRLSDFLRKWGRAVDQWSSSGEIQ